MRRYYERIVEPMSANSFLLYNLRQNTKEMPSSYKRNADYGKLRAHVEEIKIAMAPPLEGQLLTAESLLRDEYKRIVEPMSANSGCLLGSFGIKLEGPQSKGYL